VRAGLAGRVWRAVERESSRHLSGRGQALNTQPGVPDGLIALLAKALSNEQNHIRALCALRA